MARFAAVLVLGLALAAAGAAGAAAAPCRVTDDDMDWNGGGCLQCIPAQSRCEQCAERWVLTPDGQCAKCNATHIGWWQESCSSCRPDDPTVCLKCDNYPSGHRPGFFVTQDGACSACPAGAATCKDFSGEVTGCQDGLGLVGGECRPCKVPDCRKCDGDLWKCTECVNRKAYGANGIFPDPATGACVSCDKGCKTCTGPGACLQCALSVVDPATRTCPPCTVANCYQCLESLDKCDECAKGYRVDAASNTCVPCSIANCSTCDDGSRCSACMPGYGLVNPQRDESFQYSTACHACAKADPNCLACDGDPAVCSQCADGMAPDPASGLCVPCRLENARTNASCSDSDATRCDEDDQCLVGWYCHNVTGQCTACPATGCADCSSDAPDQCTQCLRGYWDASVPINAQNYRASTAMGNQRVQLEELPPECEPCADPNCLACDASWGAACERCADGYFLDSATKLCRACSEPDGAMYDTCDPAQAQAAAPAAA